MSPSLNIENFLTKYTIIEEISMQSNAEVLLCYNNSTKNIEVLKILKNRSKKRLQKEAVIAMKFNHENIISATEEQDLITDDGSFCKILTYKKCDEDLFDFFPKISSKKEMYDVMKQMAKAVEYLHKNNMAHCDIKLENFLVDYKKTGEPKVYLTDFEHLIHQNKKKTKKYSSATYIYRSPETFKKKRKIDAKAVDVFALGASFHSILSGFLPFISSETEEEERNNVKKGKIEIGQDITSNEHDLMEKMLDRNPKTRITISEVLNHPLFQ